MRRFPSSVMRALTGTSLNVKTRRAYASTLASIVAAQFFAPSAPKPSSISEKSSESTAAPANAPGSALCYCLIFARFAKKNPTPANQTHHRPSHEWKYEQASRNHPCASRKGSGSSGSGGSARARLQRAARRAAQHALVCSGKSRRRSGNRSGSVFALLAHCAKVWATCATCGPGSSGSA